MNPADLFKSYPGFPALLCVLLLLPFAARTLPAGWLLLRALALVVVVTALGALALAGLNFSVPDFIDNVEPTVIGNAWIWWHGGALYPPLDVPGVPELRGLLYGPLTFIAAGAAPSLLGGTILVAKLPALLAFAGTLLLMWFACRRLRATRGVALLATAATAIVLSISEAPYWIRADTALMLIAAFCAWLLARRADRVMLRSLLLGVLAGVASGFKLHGALYVAPACLLAVVDATVLIHAGPTLVAPLRTERWRITPRLHQRWARGVASAVLIVVAASIVLAAPFLLPGVNPRGYLSYLELAAHHGLSRQLLLGNITLVAGVALPLVALAWQLRTAGRRLSLRWSVLAATVLLCALAVAVIASKPGAGYPHLLPFVPYAGLLLCTLLSGLAGMDRRPGTTTGSGVPGSIGSVGVAVLFCLAFCTPLVVRAALFARRQAEFATIAAGHAQVLELLRQQPDRTVAVGYGGDGFVDLRLSYLRALPVMATGRMPYDATAMDDLWQGGLDRRLALRGIESCAVQTWLLPPGPAFSIGNFYGGQTFSDEFRALFAARYREEPSAGPFHIWVCRDTPAAK